MRSDWLSLPLADLVEPDSPITYGVVKPGPEDIEGVKFIRGGDIADGRVLQEQLRTITDEISTQYKRTLLRGGELVVSLVGNPGQVAIVPASLKGANIARQVGLVRLANGTDSRFVKYYLSSPAGQEALGAHSLGSVQQVINLRDLKTVKIPMPPLAAQRSIADVLAAIDDRIDLQRQTNATLESIAQALFKSWFIDFDPVRAKAEGREPEGIDAATAALFPAEFEESALGLIPKGWSVTELGQLCRLEWGNTTITKKSYVNSGFPAFSAAGQDGYVAVAERSGIGSVISAIGTVGVVHLAFGHWTAIKNTLTAQCSSDKESAWLYNLLRTVRFPSRGSTQQFISQSDARGVKVVASPIELRNCYGGIAEDLIHGMASTQARAASLAAIRDALLPRLISGKLRLPEAEAQIEEAIA